MSWKIVPLLCLVGSLFSAPSQVVVSFQGCRTGDRLIHYAKARWVAKKYGLELLTHRVCERIRPLVITDLHRDIDTPGLQRLPYRNTMMRPRDLPSKKLQDHEIFVTYSYRDEGWEPFEVGTWRQALADRCFRDALTETLRPKEWKKIEREFTLAPQGTISVALHVRTGEGVDRPCISPLYYELSGNEIRLTSQQMRLQMGRKTFSDVVFPLKFPPRQYYIDQLQRLDCYLGAQPFHVILFTDSQCPLELLADLKQRLDLPYVSWSTYQGPLRGKDRILSDLWSMTYCDYLIRGGSNYAQVAHLIGHHKGVIYPLDSYWADGCLVMDRVQMDVYE